MKEFPRKVFLLCDVQREKWRGFTIGFERDSRMCLQHNVNCVCVCMCVGVCVCVCIYSGSRTLLELSHPETCEETGCSLVRSTSILFSWVNCTVVIIIIIINSLTDSIIFFFFKTLIGPPRLMVDDGAFSHKIDAGTLLF